MSPAQDPHPDVIVVGAGAAGAAVAAMLGHRGVPTVLVDPRAAAPPDFRCEKLEGHQVTLADQAGLGPALRRVSTPAGALWIVRYGRVVERRAVPQLDFRYPDLVDAFRGEVGGSARLEVGKVVDLRTGPDRQEVELEDGRTLRSRLVVLATGLSRALPDHLGLRREVCSPGHSLCVGFDLESELPSGFPVPALTWYPDRPDARIAYLTLFPIAGRMRANLFLYRALQDPWLDALRADPLAALRPAMPDLERMLGPSRRVGAVRVRQSDLFDLVDLDRSGLVVVGDAAGTSCPAAGTGLDNVLTDAVRLCQEHLPRWLSTPGMGSEKIASFYADPVRRQCRERCRTLAFAVRRRALDQDLRARARRRLVFAGQLLRGGLRRGA
ncbi:FAD-dependent monooxygenase [Myxococcota bacterium]|nr:FAD-dependent monooxygenase [Myxococcota bacterium]